MSNKKPKMDVTKAVGRELYQQDQEAREAKADRAKKGKGKKGGKVSGSFPGGSKTINLLEGLR